MYYFSENFMLLSCYQALVMLVQNRYQRRRMYTVRGCALTHFSGQLRVPASNKETTGSATACLSNPAS